MWKVQIEGQGLVELEELPYPECVVAYYKQLGPDVLATLTGKTRKQIISTASRLSVSISPRQKKRTAAERELAIRLIEEVHDRTTMTLAEKMAYVGAKSKSDYKHLARAAGVSEDYVDIWKPFRSELNAVIIEAGEKGEVPITYLREQHSVLYWKLLYGPAEKDEEKLRKAVYGISMNFERDGGSVKRHGDFWADHKPRMIKILHTYNARKDKSTLLDHLTFDENINFYNQLLETKTEKVVINAFRDLNKKIKKTFSGTTRRSVFWEEYMPLMELVQEYQLENECGIIRALKRGFPNEYEELTKHKTDSAINHAFQSGYLSMAQEEYQLHLERMGF